MSMNRMLSWFPSAWRSRYEAEVRELLEAHPFTWRERRDLMRACADAWARETRAWGIVALRFSAAVAVRLGVVLLLGWLGVRGLEWLVPNDALLAWWPTAAADQWYAVLTVCKLAVFFVVVRGVMQPYERTLDPDRRPTWLQTCGWLGTLSLLLVFDGRPANLPDAMWTGVFGLLRHSPWLHVIGSDGRMRTTVLGPR